MGAFAASTTRANTSTSTCAAPARSSARAQASDGGAGGEHIVDQDQAAPRDLGLAGRIDAERALHVGGALGARQPDLLRGRLDAAQRRRASPGRRSPREIACASAADWLKRRAHSRRQCSGTGTSASAPSNSSFPARDHPAAEQRRKIEPVAILEGVHQLGGDVVVAHGGARALVGRRIGDRLHRQDAGAGVVGERNAEPRAIGRRDEGELAPAGGAHALVGHEIAARRAEPRQRGVERRAAASRAGLGRGARGGTELRRPLTARGSSCPAKAGHPVRALRLSCDCVYWVARFADDDA